jgi:hypothetical protein
VECPGRCRGPGNDEPNRDTCHRFGTLYVPARPIAQRDQSDGDDERRNSSIAVITWSRISSVNWSACRPGAPTTCRTRSRRCRGASRPSRWLQDERHRAHEHPPVFTFARERGPSPRRQVIRPTSPAVVLRPAAAQQNESEVKPHGPEQPPPPCLRRNPSKISFEGRSRPFCRVVQAVWPRRPAQSIHLQ